jgi:hypothetical protein
MPSKSPAQARLMAACAHGAGYQSCPPDKVSKEFNQADKGGAMLHNAMMKPKKKSKLRIGNKTY